MIWPTATLGDISSPKQWPTLSKAEMLPSGVTVYGANGPIGFTDRPTHTQDTILVGCRGSCGTLHVMPANSYANGNAMALDNLKTDIVDLRYLVRFLERRGFKDVISGSSQPQIIRSNIVRIEVPLPPLDEQRRIAAALDRADALRQKRKRAIALLDSLTQSIFVEMFGQLSLLPTTTFEQLLPGGLRNGVSPSTDGTVESDVLTLSAVTGGQFDASARKTAFFKVMPVKDKTVARDDFLICRGNGNKELVGLGKFPDQDMASVAFPDTIIAGRVDCRRIDREYLSALWNSPHVRKQIEVGARTTNGTFKVNQEVIGAIKIPLADLARQKLFGANVRAAQRQLSAHTAALERNEQLFVTLQHRAFAGRS